MNYMALGKKKFENLFKQVKFKKVGYYGDYNFSKYFVDFFAIIYISSFSGSSI